VLVNPGECFDAPGYLRIGLGQRMSGFAESLQVLATALEAMKEQAG
jgi:hypothetical protein